MDKKDALDLLTQVAHNALTPEQALEALRIAPFAQTATGMHLDLHRRLRTGLGEVVFGKGKSPEQLLEAVAGLGLKGDPVLATKLAPEQGRLLQQRFPDGQFWAQAGLFAWHCAYELQPESAAPAGDGTLVILSAGASDAPVATEAFGTARFLGLNPGLVTDVGVAGLHRLQPYLPQLHAARLLVVVAGMEGALPSVLGGLTGRPIIAVPTSVGYGAAFDGLSALLGMLNSCAPGISVVNIDNGFGAAVTAAMLLQHS